MVKLMCSCKHKYQDEKHGKGMRIHNPTKDENVFRCTVCSKTRNK